MSPKIDHLYYDSLPIPDLVSVLFRKEFICAKLNDSSGQSVKFMLSHEESINIGHSIFDLFKSICLPETLNLKWASYDFLSARFTQEIKIGPLSIVKGFENLNCDGINLFFVVDNHYHLFGKLEISLCLRFKNDKVVVFDKWTVANAKTFFNDFEIKIGLDYNNFERRSKLITDLSEKAFAEFDNSLVGLKEFIAVAQDLQLNIETLKAVYLDLKDRNRSETSLKLSKDSIEEIKKDLRKVEAYCASKRNQTYTYFDFLFIISITLPSFESHKDFEITASSDYKRLKKMVMNFKILPEKSRPVYEEEQVNIFREIIHLVGQPSLWDQEN
jgi:hypothetical protein